MTYISGLKDLISIKQKYPGLEMILHTDQGSVYASKDFNELLPLYNIVHSMSRAGTPTDNAAMEAINGWIKTEMFTDLHITSNENIENEIKDGDAPIRWIVDDCKKFVEREIRRGNHYDAIIMDPPSYGRGPKGEIWKIEDAIHPLVKLCTKILSDDPLFFLINSYTTGLAPAVLTYMLATEMKKYNGHVDSQEIGLPVKSNGLVLPCGASGRWEANE